MASLVGIDPKPKFDLPLLCANCGLMRRTKKPFLDGLRPLIKQASVGVATAREDRRPPRSDPAVQHRRWGREHRQFAQFGRFHCTLQKLN
jgi:hypothetical protein